MKRSSNAFADFERQLVVKRIKQEIRELEQLVQPNHATMVEAVQRAMKTSPNAEALNGLAMRAQNLVMPRARAPLAPVIVKKKAARRVRVKQEIVNGFVAPAPRAPARRVRVKQEMLDKVMELAPRAPIAPVYVKQEIMTELVVPAPRAPVFIKQEIVDGFVRAQTAPRAHAPAIFKQVPIPTHRAPVPIKPEPIYHYSPLLHANTYSVQNHQQWRHY